MKNQFSLLAWSDFYWLRTVGPVLKSQIVSNLKWKYINPEDNKWDFVVIVIFKVKKNMTVIVSKYCVDSYLFEKLSQKKSHWSQKYM